MPSDPFPAVITFISFLVKIFAVCVVYVKVNKVSGLWGFAYLGSGIVLRIPIFIMLLLGANSEKFIDEWNSRLTIYVLPTASILFAAFAISLAKQFSIQGAKVGKAV
jgi:hypothetical protein